MRIGMIGLGKMGGNMAQRLTMGGHEVVGYDPHPPDAARVQEMKATLAKDLAALVASSRHRERSGSWSRPERSPRTP